MIRLRQIALVARDLDMAVEQAQEFLKTSVCFRDPGVAEFGLHNALFRIGNQFLEIVSPVADGTTAGRLLDRVGGDSGYMALFEVDDLDSRMDHLARIGVRTVWKGDFLQIRGRHLHPKDTGGTLVSLDQPERVGAWHWGGPHWHDHPPSGVAGEMTGITLSSADPGRCAARWSELGIDFCATFVGQTSTTAPDSLVGVRLTPVDPSLDGATFRLCGVDFTYSTEPSPPAH